MEVIVIACIVMIVTIGVIQVKKHKNRGVQMSLFYLNSLKDKIVTVDFSQTDETETIKQVMENECGRRDNTNFVSPL